jgi:lysophospholipase L1-like esterase
VNADASVLAGSGWGIYSDNQGNTGNVMPALFGNVLGERATPAWSFAAEPQAVIINLGTNDASAKTLTARNFKRSSCVRWALCSPAPIARTRNGS